MRGDFLGVLLFFGKMGKIGSARLWMWVFFLSFLEWFFGVFERNLQKVSTFESFWGLFEGFFRGVFHNCAAIFMWLGGPVVSVWICWVGVWMENMGER